MTEQLGRGPENQPPTPEQNMVLNGVTKVVDVWRRVRIGQLQNDISQLDDTIDSARSTLGVNQVTGKYAHLQNVAFGGVKEPTTPDAPEEGRQNWITMAGHTSKSDTVAKDGTEAKSLRPTTKPEQRIKRKVERAEARTVRPAGVVIDLHRIYDLPDEEAINALPDIPNRRPNRGNEKARALVDESLRRTSSPRGGKLLEDQPARGPEPKIRLGTEEHKQATSEQRLQEGLTARGSEAKRIRKATKVQARQGKAVTRQVGYVERVASGTDRKAKKLNRKITRAQNQIVKKRRKIVTHAAKLS